VKQSQATVAGKKVSPESSAYVLIGHRDSAKRLQDYSASCNEQPAPHHLKAMEMWEQFSKVAMCVMVLNREALMQHYGPTFKLLGGFMMDYARRHHE
jgi:hypothetical protein